MREREHGTEVSLSWNSTFDKNLLIQEFKMSEEIGEV